MSIMLLLLLLVPTLNGAAEPSGCLFSSCIREGAVIRGTIVQHLVANYC